MKQPHSSLLCTLCFWLAVSIDANGQTVDPAQAPRTPPPGATGAAGGAAAGVVAAPLAVERPVGGTLGQAAVVALVAGVAGFAAAASNGSASANH